MRKRIRKQSNQPIPKLKRKADRALQDYFRSKNLKCFVCNRRAEVMHHFVPQSQSAFLKYSEDNLVELCHSCHFRHHRTNDPTIHATIMMRKGQEWINKIMAARKKYLDTNNRKFLEDIINKYKI